MQEVAFYITKGNLLDYYTLISIFQTAFIGILISILRKSKS